VQSPLKNQNSALLYVFMFFWIWIGVVSCIDTHLSLKYKDCLVHVEENPIAKWILTQDDAALSRFVGIKMFGTIVVLWFLIWFYSHSVKWGLTIACALAVFQTGLLLYLFFL
jgi:hypothetical protein